MAHSFDEAFEAEFDSLHTYLRRRFGDAADDLAAETFAIAYRRWDDLDPSRPVRPWLYGIAGNVIRHHWRKERRMLRAYARTGLDPVISPEDVPIGRAAPESLKRALAEALAGLRQGEREILLLHAWAELSDTEIAAALALPLGTVKSRLHRARQRMRNRLDVSGQVEIDTLAALEEIPR